MWDYFVYSFGTYRELQVLTRSCPTRRSSVLVSVVRRSDKQIKRVPVLLDERRRLVDVGTRLIVARLRLPDIEFRSDALGEPRPCEVERLPECLFGIARDPQPVLVRRKHKPGGRDFGDQRCLCRIPVLG